jgi:NTP pyrophosphatase (non-canonical NTP hydrolase)
MTTDVEAARNSELTFGRFSSTNLARAKRWHDGGIAMWSVSDWLMAMAGEAGEACNAGKKLRRIEEQIVNLRADPERQISDRQSALIKIVEELADTVIYCDLVAARIGMSLSEGITKKFNEVSERYGFPERL